MVASLVFTLRYRCRLQDTKRNRAGHLQMLTVDLTQSLWELASGHLQTLTVCLTESLWELASHPLPQTASSPEGVA